MTRRFWLAGAVVLLLIVGLTTWRLVSAGRSNPDHASTRCTPARPVPDRAPTAGELRVVEQGFTQIDGNGKVVSVGAVVENESDAVAYRTPVHIKVFDASHSQATTDSGGLLSQVIPVLMPGERIGVGAWAYLRSDSVTGNVTHAASVELELGPSQWFPPDDSAAFFAAITTTHKHTQLTTTGGPAYGSIAFTAESPYCQSITDRGVATVFRNSDGLIIGGNLAEVFPRGCEPGQADKSATITAGIPGGFDDARTSHYLYCDPSPIRPQSTTSDQPAN
jgi:hypothetical protein